MLSLFIILFVGGPTTILLSTMDKKDVMNYEAPQVEVVEVNVEKGFAASGGGEGGQWYPGNM